RLAELHDVQPALAQRRADRGRWVRLACRNLQLDVANDLLGHGLLLIVSASARSVTERPELLGMRSRALRQVRRRGPRCTRTRNPVHASSRSYAKSPQSFST